MKKILTLTLLLLSPFIWAKEMPSWGMTEKQFKMPNFTTKMQEIGDQAFKNNWLLKITAPEDWHNKIRSGLSREGENNVQINFKDSLYKSISMTATQGMNLNLTQNRLSQTATAKKQVIIDKPDMETNIERPEFDNSEFNNTDELMDDIGQLELTLPNGQTLNKINKTNADTKQVAAKKPTNGNAQESAKSNDQKTQAVAQKETTEVDNVQDQREAIEHNMRMRYTGNKTVDKTISYNHIAEDDDLYVEGKVVLVKRYVNRGVAVYYWMTEDYDPELHSLEPKDSNKFKKLATGEADNSIKAATKTQSSPKSQETNQQAFDFVAVTDQNDVQVQLRREFIRNKTVSSNIKAGQLKSGDKLYVSQQTILVERPIGNTRSIYFWLDGETNISQEVNSMGPQEYKIN